MERQILILYESGYPSSYQCKMSRLLLSLCTLPFVLVTSVVERRKKKNKNNKIKIRQTNVNEHILDETYNKICATSEYSDQPVHTHSLIRIFAGRVCFLQPPRYPKRINKEL